MYTGAKIAVSAASAEDVPHVELDIDAIEDLDSTYLATFQSPEHYYVATCCSNETLNAGTSWHQGTQLAAWSSLMIMISATIRGQPQQGDVSESARLVSSDSARESGLLGERRRRRHGDPQVELRKVRVKSM